MESKFCHSEDDDDLVYDRPVEIYYDDEQEKVRPYHRLIFSCLLLLFTFSFVTMLTSGLVFGHRIETNDCLSQSWVMFSSLMGLLYIALHLQAAWQNEPVNRSRPFQHPLHSSAIVVARIDILGWIVSLIVCSVTVSKGPPAPVPCVNLVACAAVTPALMIVLCVIEKANRPFDLPWITPRARRVTCRVSALIDDMADQSISRRGSDHRSVAETVHNDDTPLRGPRAPPASVKEARPWSFTKFDDRTKKELSESVDEANHQSETRRHVSGPRPLLASNIAVKTGVLPPPVCTDPNPTLPPMARPESPARGWRRDWTALAAATGWMSPGPTGGSASSSTAGSSCFAAEKKRLSLSPVREATTPMCELHAEPSRRVQQRPAATSQYLQQRTPPPPPPTTRPRNISSSSNRPPVSIIGPRAQPPSRPVQSRGGSGRRSLDMPRPPPAVADAGAARGRLQRAQEALKNQRRTTSESHGQSRTSQELVPVRPKLVDLRIPGSFVDDGE